LRRRFQARRSAAVTSRKRTLTISSKIAAAIANWYSNRSRCQEC
jgi:hypothetical protein